MFSIFGEGESDTSRILVDGWIDRVEDGRGRWKFRISVSASTSTTTMTSIYRSADAGDSRERESFMP